MLELDEFYSWIQILVESHDGILIQIPIGRETEAKEIAHIAFEKEIDFNECSMKRDFRLVIPIEVKFGKNWYEMEEMI